MVLHFSLAVLAASFARLLPTVASDDDSSAASRSPGKKRRTRKHRAIGALKPDSDAGQLLKRCFLNHLEHKPESFKIDPNNFNHHDLGLYDRYRETKGLEKLGLLNDDIYTQSSLLENAKKIAGFAKSEHTQRVQYTYVLYYFISMPYHLHSTAPQTSLKSFLGGDVERNFPPEKIPKDFFPRKHEFFREKFRRSPVSPKVSTLSVSTPPTTNLSTVQSIVLNARPLLLLLLLLHRLIHRITAPPHRLLLTHVLLHQTRNRLLLVSVSIPLPNLLQILPQPVLPRWILSTNPLHLSQSTQMPTWPLGLSTKTGPLVAKMVAVAQSSISVMTTISFS